MILVSLFPKIKRLHQYVKSYQIILKIKPVELFIYSVIRGNIYSSIVFTEISIKVAGVVNLVFTD